MCQIHLCATCVGEHLSDESKEHNVVPLKIKGPTVLCKEHSTKICELHCEQCNSPICALCVSSVFPDKHVKHKKGRRLKSKMKNYEKIYKNWNFPSFQI